MKYYNNIDEIILDDTRWRKLAYKIAKGNKSEGDEIISIFYIYYLEMKNPPPINQSYIYQALYNNYVQLQMKKNNRVSYDESDYDNEENHNNEIHYISVDQDYYIYDDADDVNNDNLYKSILLDIEGLDYFNKTLFKLNMIERLSIRQIRKEYNLSYSTIQKSIATTKQMIKNKYKDNE